MIEIDGKNLTIEQVAEVATSPDEVRLSPEAIPAIQQAHEWVREISLGDKPVYGINTGFGIFSESSITHSQIAKLNRNLILSHAVGTGPDFSPEITRAAILIREQYPGPRTFRDPAGSDRQSAGIIEQKRDPVHPLAGVAWFFGRSGPALSSCLVLTTDKADRDEDSGYAQYNGGQMTGKAAMTAAGIERVHQGQRGTGPHQWRYLFRCHGSPDQYLGGDPDPDRRGSHCCQPGSPDGRFCGF